MFVYQDLNGFSPETRPLINDFDAILQSLFNIFNTNPGERPFEPEFGLSIEDDLFELIDDGSAFAIKDKIVKAVSRWEKRVTINQPMTSVTAYPDENMYDVIIAFNVNGISNQMFEYRGSFSK